MCNCKHKKVNKYAIVFQNACSTPSKCKCGCDDCGGNNPPDPVDPKWPDGAEEGDIITFRSGEPVWEPFETQFTSLLDPRLDGLMDEIEIMIENATGDNQLHPFLMTIKNIAYQTLQDEWLVPNGLIEGLANNGGGVSIPNKTITLNTGTTSADSYLKESFFISAFPQYSVGTILKFQAEIGESVIGAIGPNNLEVNFYVNDVKNEDVIITMTPFAGSLAIFNLDFEYQIANMADEYALELKVPSSAGLQSPGFIINWTSFSVISTDNIYNTITKAIANTLRRANQLYLHLFRSPRLSTANPSGTGDQSAIIQDEIKFAEDTSGEWIIPQNAKFRWATSIEITKGIKIRGAGTGNGQINPGANIPMFTVKTNESVIFKDFSFVRADPTFTSPDFVRFIGSDTGVTYKNSNSFIERIVFSNVPTALNIDYTDYLTIKNCSFNSGQYGIRGGYVDKLSNSNVNIIENLFNSINFYGIDFVGANMLNIIDNDFVKNPASSAEVRRNIMITISDGEHENIKITNNKSSWFTEYGIIIAVSGTGKVQNLYIMDNGLTDESASLTSLPIAITTDALDKIKTVTIHRNPIGVKVYGLYLKNINIVNIMANTYEGVTGFPNTRANYFEGIDNMIYSNTLNNLVNIFFPDTVTP